jgi:hypothetical protein
MDAEHQVPSSTTRIDSKPFRDAWVSHIENGAVEEVLFETKPEGKQAEYANGIFVYESYDVFIARAKVWGKDKLTVGAIEAIVAKKKLVEPIDFETINAIEAMATKDEKVEKIIDAWGVDHDYYEKIHTLPDGSIFVKLKAEFI